VGIPVIQSLKLQPNLLLNSWSRFESLWFINFLLQVSIFARLVEFWVDGLISSTLMKYHFIEKNWISQVNLMP
jgi:hypothetical protein